MLDARCQEQQLSDVRCQILEKADASCQSRCRISLGQDRTTQAQIRSHRDLIVWQKAMELVVRVYRESERFPKTEMYGLTSQTRRAVGSIPANIAEGQGRRLPGEYLYFLGNARGSLSELDTHLELAVRLGYVDPDKHLLLLDQLAEVGRLLNGLMRSLYKTRNA